LGVKAERNLFAGRIVDFIRLSRKIPAIRMVKNRRKKMAHIEIATFVDTGEAWHANVGDTVGVGKTNENNDVMLIQAFINLIGFNPVRAQDFFDIKPGDPLPKPDGILDNKTIRAIWRFQVKSDKEVLRKDGIIHPASYHHRKIAKGQLMTITLLNRHALGVAGMIHKSSNLRTLLLKFAPGLLLPIRLYSP
jgi:hypothetical protein